MKAKPRPGPATVRTCQGIFPPDSFHSDPRCQSARTGRSCQLKIQRTTVSIIRVLALISPRRRKISLNIRHPASIYMRVRRFQNIVFALAAFLWLPVSAHCQLEIVTGLEFLACPTEGDCHDNQSSGRSDTGCCSVEKSEYKSNRSLLTPPSPYFVALYSRIVLAAADTLPAQVSVGILTAAPPEFLKTWHFVSRTALPVRAPSIAS